VSSPLRLRAKWIIHSYFRFTSIKYINNICQCHYATLQKWYFHQNL
jgi:hypothetical protein